MTADGRLTGRVALITGASRGIGAAVARRFAAEGAHVVLVARTAGGLEEIDDGIRAVGGSATLVPMDLRDHEAIDRLGAALFERYGKLDIMVGNAGLLGTLAPIAQVKPPEWAEVLDVNVTANWRLIRIMDPLLRAADAGRAMFVTSTVGHAVRAYWATYAVSKAALEMMVGIYAAELQKTNLRVNLINPGAVRTRMRAKAYPGEDPETLKTPDEITDVFVELAEPACTRHGETVSAQPR